MPITMEQVQEQLDRYEPNYAEAARLGPEAVPFLEELADSGPLPLAMRAVHLASLIGGDRAVGLLQRVVESPVPELRLQAVGGARNVPAESAASILLKVRDDPDAGVRKAALRSAMAIPLGERITEELERRFREITEPA